jgi:O-antigen/teichoic acid export membrane protein
VNRPSVLGRARSGIVRRSAWVVADQLLSSITNFALMVAVARVVDAEAFGAFGIGFALYRFVLGVGTGLWVVPVMVTHAAAEGHARRHQVSRAAGAALLTGVVAAPPIAALGLALDGPLRGALVGVALCLPGLALQDGWRQGFVAMGEPRSAAVNDLAWAGGQAACVATLLLAVEEPSVLAIVLAWGLPGAAAAGLACVQARSLPRVVGTLGLAREHRRLGPRFAGEFVVNSGQGQLTLFTLAAVAGTAATGGFRGSQVVFGPQRVVSNGLALAALPEAVRLRDHPPRLRRITGLLSGVNVAMVVAVGAVLIGLPETWGRELLGETWSEARPLVVPMIAYGVAGAIASGPSVGLRAVGAARACLRNQTLTSVLALGLTVAGTFLAGASGAAWGLAVATTVGAVLWVLDWHRQDGTVLDEALAPMVASGTAPPHRHGAASAP